MPGMRRPKKEKRNAECIFGLYKQMKNDGLADIMSANPSFAVPIRFFLISPVRTSDILREIFVDCNFC